MDANSRSRRILAEILNPSSPWTQSLQASKFERILWTFAYELKCLAAKKRNVTDSLNPKIVGVVARCHTSEFFNGLKDVKSWKPNVRSTLLVREKFASSMHQWYCGYQAAELDLKIIWSPFGKFSMSSQYELSAMNDKRNAKVSVKMSAKVNDKANDKRHR